MKSLKLVVRKARPKQTSDLSIITTGGHTNQRFCQTPLIKPSILGKVAASFAAIETDELEPSSPLIELNQNNELKKVDLT